MLKFSANNLLSLVNDILDINKLGSGKLELDNVPFNCYVLVNSVSSSMTHRLKRNHYLCGSRLNPQIIKVTYDGDPTRLSQVLFNLIGNAVKFTKKGSVTVSLMLLTQEENRDLIRFQVVNTGIGISESQQRVIFDPFMQASANTTRQFGGTGLGLSIVKQLIEMFGSEVKLESAPGTGTTIYFDLLLKRSTFTLSKKTNTIELQEMPFDHLQVLLAEDNMMNIYFMRQLFQGLNIKIDVAGNGKDALQMLNEKDYDVIFMDVNMPIMDGLETTARIRNLQNPFKSATYIVALTAEVSEDIRRKLMALGMNDYLPKPFQLEELRNKLVDLAAKISNLPEKIRP